jgi:uncharacterized protein YjcR
MARKETIQRKKDYAKLLYTVQGVTVGKELAERAGVSEQTITKWKKEEHWEKLRASVIITKEEQIRRFYAQVTELNDAIEKRKEGERYASASEADTLVKITKAIKELETETNVAQAMEVLKEFIIHIRMEDFAKAQEITQLADEFIKTLLK